MGASSNDYVTASERGNYPSPAGLPQNREAILGEVQKGVQCGATAASLGMTLSRLRHCDPTIGGVAVYCKAEGEIPRFARNDINRFTSPRASAASVAVSRKAVAKAVRGESIYLLGVFAPLRWGYPLPLKHDLNAKTPGRKGFVLKAAWRSPARPLRRLGGRFPPALYRTQCGRFPPALHQTQCGASVALLGMTFIMVLCGAGVTSLGVTAEHRFHSLSNF